MCDEVVIQEVTHQKSFWGRDSCLAYAHLEHAASTVRAHRLERSVVSVTLLLWPPPSTAHVAFCKLHEAKIFFSMLDGEVGIRVPVLAGQLSSRLQGANCR
eukprot:5675787-Amphidinium_carterae.1